MIFSHIQQILRNILIKIIKKLETRFGVKVLTETSKAKFLQASQRPDESLEDWADCDMTLATPAFVDLPEYLLKQGAIYQYISQAVDGKKARTGTDLSINAEQAPSEARIEQLIA